MPDGGTILFNAVISLKSTAARGHASVVALGYPSTQAFDIGVAVAVAVAVLVGRGVFVGFFVSVGRGVFVGFFVAVGGGVGSAAPGCGATRSAARTALRNSIRVGSD